MNISELAEVVATRERYSMEKGRILVDAILGTITEELSCGGIVKLGSFGTFFCKLNNPRVFKNPVTGIVRELPAKIVPKFRAGDALKQSVKLATESYAISGGRRSDESNVYDTKEQKAVSV